MKRIIVSLLIAIVSMNVSIFGLNLDLVSSFTGDATPAGTFYVGVGEEIDLLLGFSSSVPFSEDWEVDLDLLVGVSLGLPVLGKSDIAFVINKATNLGGGLWTASAGAVPGSKLYVKELVLMKNWLFPLTDQLTVGVRAELVSIALDGRESLLLLQSINPVIGLTLQINS